MLKYQCISHPSPIVGQVWYLFNSMFGLVTCLRTIKYEFNFILGILLGCQGGSDVEFF